MKLTIQQALHRGVAAHKKGKLQDAERLYRAILQSQPAHPDANHNLGILAVSVNKAAAALPLFKTALEENPKVEQFWLSYIDALITLERFDEAKRVLVEGEKADMSSERLDALNQRLEETKPYDANKTAKVQTLPEKKSKKRTAQRSSSGAAPSQDQINHFLGHYQAGRLEEAGAFATSLIQQFPKHPVGWKFLGDVLKQMGRLDEALASYTQAIALKPDYAEAHSNLGNIMKELGRLDEALASYMQAVALKPNFAEAHYNLGNTLKELGRLDEALASYTQAIALKSNFPQAYVNLGFAIKNAKFNSSNPSLYPALTKLLTTGNFTRPIDVARNILNLLKQDLRMKDLLLEKNFTVSLKETISLVRSLDKFPLLHNLMRVCPLPDLQYEKLFVAMRSSVLRNLDEIEVLPELIYFLSTLSLQSFINEYVYIENDEETNLISELQAEISQTLAKSEQPEIVKILCLASYRSLHRYDWCQKLESLDGLEEVKRRLIDEPFLEKTIAKNIPVLEEISNDVSLKVKEQYEENPYPRWVKLGVSVKAKPIVTICDLLKLQLFSENIKNVTAPAVLIAGCGTGQHPIETASHFSNCHVTAVDLSLASLAYAKRKSNELHLTNIDYLQADILHLHQMSKQFDIVESSGVLHHMDEPMAGWTVLVDLLKPGGLMKVGLYSELARQHIVQIRKEITALGVGTSEANIRKFRQSVAESDNESHQLLIKSSDFFSLSELRDSIFHVQEHRFTLPQIKNCLDELGLGFCGFEELDIVFQFKEFHGEEKDTCDLVLWHEFEERNPLAFGRMYQFWCQKL